jgi:hypothetical protein
VLITKAVVLENVNPTIVPRSAPPSRRGRAQDREEKSA